MSTEASEELADLYKAGMRRLASGVSLVTSAKGVERVGLVATAVSSVSTEPPTLLVCINHTASAHNIINEVGAFCVNILTSENFDIASQFSSSNRRHERFTSGNWAVLETGAPVLLDALVAFDCCVVNRVVHSTHTIFLGEVRNLQLSQATTPPLIYMDRSFHDVVLGPALNGTAP